MKKAVINLVKVRYALRGNVWERVLYSVTYSSGAFKRYEVAPCTVCDFIYKSRCIEEKYNYELGICDRYFAYVGVNHGC